MEEQKSLDQTTQALEKFGSNHPDTLTSMANLAYTYWHQGRLDAAYSLLFTTVKEMQHVMGAQHPILVLQYIEGLNQLCMERSKYVTSQHIILPLVSYYVDLFLCYSSSFLVLACQSSGLVRDCSLVHPICTIDESGLDSMCLSTNLPYVQFGFIPNNKMDVGYYIISN